MTAHLPTDQLAASLILQLESIVGADGVIQASLPPFTTGVLTGEIRAHGGLTPYGRWGDWPAVGLILVLLVFGLRRRS